MAARVRYARTADGVDIAYGVLGTGPPLLVVRPLLRPTIDDDLAPTSDEPWLRLASGRSLVVWDHRGLGLSSAAPFDYTMQPLMLDIEAVVDALNLERFDLLAHLSPCHIGIAFAARHASRMGRLALWNPARPGASVRAAVLSELPDIASTHFREYVQLVALRVHGWERGQAWANNMLEHFTYETWERLIAQTEELDATQEASALLVPALVIIDHTSRRSRGRPNLPAPLGGGAEVEAEAYRRRLAALLPKGELAVLKEADGRDYVDVVEAFLASGADATHAEDAAQRASFPKGMVVVLFTDIVDSTALTERLGDAAFRSASRSLDEAVRKTIREAGGTPVEGKVLGDGVMGVFTSAAEAIAAARTCVELGHELPMHIGLHAGDVTHEGGNVYGGAVNIASRVCGLSEPGEILVSATVRELARTSSGVGFEDRGERELKGVGEAVRVYAVVGAEG